MSATTKHVPWSSIELLHNVVKTLDHLHELGQPHPLVEYRAKVKLHGTNCAVQVAGDGVFAQSRTTLLSPQSDYKGFATWVALSRQYFEGPLPGMVVFGEWCGPGVEAGMAISQAKSKLFVVFAIRYDDGTIVYEPYQIRTLLPAANAPPQLHVLPWEGSAITIAFSDRESLTAVANELNARVAAVEHEDPWAKNTLGISGIGEGLVFYPVSVDGAAPPKERFEQLMFKAKGEKHRTAGAKTAVQIDPSVVASAQEFVTLMVTEARLRQGLTEACNGVRDPKATRRFLEWVAADVRKESDAELAASRLSWSDVDKAVQNRAREWFRKSEQSS